MKVKILSILFISIINLSLGQNVCDNDLHSGEGTYYDFETAGGIGNCSFDDTKIQPFLIGAMNDTDYGNADYCGACIHIDGPDGSVNVQIIDRCPECKPGDVDLSPEAFEQIAPIIDGRVNIDWYVVPCQITGNTKFHYKEGSNEWWLGIQIRNTITHVAKLELKVNGVYTTLPRERYNYFIAENPNGFPSKLEFRITDVYGNIIEETEVSFNTNLIGTEVNGSKQFPSCNIVGVTEKKEELSWYISNNKIITNTPNNRYTLHSIEGKEILKGKGSIINIENLESGLYILKNQSEGRISSSKIVIN